MERVPDLFIAISENLNAGWAGAARAIESGTDAEVLRIARRAVAGGAQGLNLSGMWGLDGLCRVIEILAGRVETSIVIDTPDPETQDRAMTFFRTVNGDTAPRPGAALPPLVLNSISGEKDRYSAMLEVARRHGAGVIALCMDDRGVPRDAEGRIEAGTKLVARLLEDGLEPGRILADPLVMPVAVDGAAAEAVVRTVRELKARFPMVRLTCGLSNISHGLPGRRVLNAAFLATLINAGLDSAVMDTCDEVVGGIPGAVRAIRNQDPFCAEYIAAFRNSRPDA